MADSATIEYARAVLRHLPAPERSEVQKLIGTIASLEAEGGVLAGERKALKARANEISRQLEDAYEQLTEALPSNPAGQQIIG